MPAFQIFSVDSQWKMSTPDPHPRLSVSDKRLILLLSRMLAEAVTGIRGGNINKDTTVFSDSEFFELVDLIDNYVSSREFIEGSFFIEEISNGDPEDRARRLYLDRRARSRVMSSAQWMDFQARLGTIRSALPYRRTEKMDYSYFRRLEARLLRACGVNANVTELVISMIDAQTQEIDDLRSHRRQLRRGFIKEAIFNPIRNIRERLEDSANKISQLEIPTHKLIGAITVVSDTSVLFTTRDWGVAGTISTMAGAMISAAAQ